MTRDKKITCCSMEKGEIFPVALLNQKMPKKEKRTQVDSTHLRRRHCSKSNHCKTNRFTSSISRFTVSGSTMLSGFDNHSLLMTVRRTTTT